MENRMRKSMKKFATGICIALLVAGLSGCTEEVQVNKEVVRPIRSLVIQQPDALEQGSIAGRARAAQSVELSFRVSGPLVERPVSVGDVVEKDALIAKIDQRDFESEARRAQGVYEQANAAIARAQGDYRREMSIFKEDSGATSEAAIDRKREALARAQANVKSAQAALQTTVNQLSYTELKSPISGKVVNTYVENFETVQAKQKIVRILDNTRIKFDIDVPEQSISYVDLVRDVFVEFDAFPGVKVHAFISEIATEASQTTRTYRVTLLLDQPEKMEILAGMAGKAGFTLDRGVAQEDRALTIPTSAVFSPELGDTSYVWVLDSETMTVKKRAVKVSRISEFGAEISSGVTGGETIAIAGVHFLKDGTKVRLLSSEQEEK